jgi:ligand-binding SRPBCC domain-containing protein
MYQYKTEQILPISLKEAWDFFSSPKNLSTITPPELDFNILTNFKEEGIREGMVIDYTVKPLLGIPVHWQTEIGNVVAEKHFSDKQLKGPYKVWVHKHTFSKVNGGVLIQDEINYQLPLGFLGRMVHSLFVRKKIENIFDYRKQILFKIFPENVSNN